MKGSKKIIYLVEDSPIIANVLKKTIEVEHDIWVVPFSNCHDVIHATKQQVPDLVITDYYLDTSIDERFNGAYLFLYLFTLLALL